MEHTDTTADTDNATATVNANAVPISTIKTKKSVKQEPECCCVCVSPFNKSSRMPIKCIQKTCDFISCNECIRTYLINSSESPHCMNCKNAWPHDFVVKLSKSWVEKTYKKHRTDDLVASEISKLSTSMEAAERHKMMDNERIKRTRLLAAMNDIYRQLGSLRAEISDSEQLERQLRTGSFSTDGVGARSEFTLACSVSTCNGMLSSQYKCRICDIFTCKHCHSTLGESMDVAHACNEDDVASTTLIKKETKQCPECSARIYRISGCAQMWCTSCKNAFCWQTGKKISTSVLHNPHWFDYNRGLNQVARTPGDVLCGGFPTLESIKKEIRKYNRHKHTSSSTDINDVVKIYNVSYHITYNLIPPCRTKILVPDNELYRVNYILGKLTKDEMGKSLYSNDITRQMHIEILHAYELISVVCIDLCNVIVVTQPYIGTDGAEWARDVDKHLSNCISTRVLFNRILAKLSNTYSRTVIQITHRWEVVSYKFNNRMLELLMMDDLGEFEYSSIEKTHNPAPGIPTALCMLLGYYINDVTAPRADRLAAADFAHLICKEWVGMDNYDSAMTLLEGNGARWILLGEDRRPSILVPTKNPEVDQLVHFANEGFRKRRTAQANREIRAIGNRPDER